MIQKIYNKQEYLLKRTKLTYNTKNWTENNVYNKGYFKTILLFLTGACNLTCPGCFNIEQLGTDFQMDLDYIKKIVENNPKIDKYDIMGGEPMVHPKILEILDYLESKNKKIGLYTNGLLLEKLPLHYKNLKVNISFHSLISKDRNYKPLLNIKKNLLKIIKHYPIKIVFLLTNSNKLLLNSFTKYVEENLPIKKLTIGTIRNESDYYNDEQENILPITEYIDIVQKFIQTYNGKLNIDIFTEGVLYTKNLPKKQLNQLNRFRCVYRGGEIATCLYDIGIGKFQKFNINEEIEFSDCSKCPKTGLENCLTDKIKLTNIKYE